MIIFHLNAKIGSMNTGSYLLMFLKNEFPLIGFKKN